MPLGEPVIPRSTGPDGYTVGAPADTVPFDAGYKYTGNGFPASNDNYVMPEWKMASPQRMDAGYDAGVPLTVMRLRHADGTPYQIPVGSPNLPPGFPTQYAVNGLLPSDWKLIPKQNAPGEFIWEPLP